MAFSDRIELDIDVPFYLPNIGVYKVALHFIQALFSLLVSSLIGAAISFQKNYKEEFSQSNSKFTLVVAIGSLFIALTLAMVPISKLRIEPLKSIGSFFLRPRTDLVLNILMSLAWIIASIVVTTQALEQNSYSHEDNIKLINSNEDYLNKLRTQCNYIRAAAAFSWLGLFTWMATVISSLILFCNHKQLNKSKSSVYSEKDSYIPSSPSSYDADAPTIVQMQYSEKHKQPIVSYNDYQYQHSTSFYDPVQVSNNTTMYNSSMYIPDSSSIHLTSPYLPQTSNCITAEQVYTQHTTSSFSSPYTSDQFISAPYTTPSVQFPTYHKY